MLTIAAKQLGYRVAIYSPDADTPAGQVADIEAVGDYLDEDRLTDFARRVSVITFEFENVPSRASEVAAQHTLVRPAGNVLHITQERLREKTFLRDHGFPTTPFREVKTYADLHAAARDLGLPAVLKTASFGYDGKGQQKVFPQSDPERFLPPWAARSASTRRGWTLRRKSPSSPPARRTGSSPRSPSLRTATPTTSST